MLVCNISDLDSPVSLFGCCFYLLGTGNLDGSWHYSVGTALYL